MTKDQTLVQRLQDQAGKKWNPAQPCARHQNARCGVFDEQGQLLTLHLCSMELREVPADVWRLRVLQELHLEDNRLSRLPAEIGQLASVQRLDLRGNRLTSLPATLGQLTQLESLDLAHNSWKAPLSDLIKEGTPAILAYLRAG